MTPAMVPLTEQYTETEQYHHDQQQGDALPLPWHDWEELEVMPADLALLSMEAQDGELVARLPDQPARKVAASFLESLGEETTFPPLFVQKLSPATQAQVINERLAATPPRAVSLVIRNGIGVRFLPGDRAVLAPAAVCDRVYHYLEDHFGGVQIEEATERNGEHWLRLSTPFVRRLTGEIVATDRGRHEFLDRDDDVLALGVQVRHELREGLSVELAVKRLLCYNTATTSRHAYSWRVREDRGEAAQLYWLDDVLEGLGPAFEQFIERGQQMADEPFTEHPRTALQAIAKAMHLPKRLLPALFAAYDQEPGNTHWSLFNAVTRLGSHADLAPSARRDICRTAGEWASHFDMVHCRLPRAIAAGVGAQIIAEPGAGEARFPALTE